MAAAAFITICGSTETRFGYFGQETSNSAIGVIYSKGFFYCMRYKHHSFSAPSTELAVRLRCVYSNVELNIAVAFEKCARKRRSGQHRNNPGKKSHARNIRLIRLRPRPSTCSGLAIALRSSTEQTRRARDSCSHRSSSPTKRPTAGEPRPFDRH